MCRFDSLIDEINRAGKINFDITMKEIDALKARDRQLSDTITENARVLNVNTNIFNSDIKHIYNILSRR
jgi:hypothetical protein